MLNLQLREPSAGEMAPTQPVVRPGPAALTEPSVPVDVHEAMTAAEEGEFEIVLGKRQLAGVLFVAIVILVVFSALSYLAGKAASPKKANSSPPSTPAPVVQSTTTIPQATIVTANDLPPAIVKPEPETTAAASPEAPNSPTTTPASPASAPAAPLFADPARGAVYLQMGAVEKGIAVIFVEGLRRRGFDSFVAPGPNEKIFRVLIGPLDHESYARAKEGLDAIGLSTFARRYQQEAPKGASGTTEPVAARRTEGSDSGKIRSGGVPHSKDSSGATEPKAPEPSEVSGQSGSLPLENSLGTLVDGPGLPIHVVH